ncbi:hypothetical protein HPB51_013720 [Rhipicephalus microplus]|uniref:Rhodanese domain-containing protein n=1 Tax=Rhipicephalus microplus TaxID=6941 RepID=A0A9J6F3E6_RHIMP|nr:hypothetical protein HPB51_013720 [Rhipicephalus microplus]
MYLLLADGAPHQRLIKRPHRVPRTKHSVKDVQEAFGMHPEDFKNRYHVEKPDPKKDIIFSCRSGRRAAIAAEKLEELGTYHK